jgi:hypothetical protein
MELVDRDSVRLGDGKLLERITTLEAEVADNDEYTDELEQQLEQLSTEKDSLLACVSVLEVGHRLISVQSSGTALPDTTLSHYCSCETGVLASCLYCKMEAREATSHACSYRSLHP